MTQTPGKIVTGALQCRFATTQAELRAAQALRYEVFVSELGSDGPLVDHGAGLEQDEFDPFASHLLLLDTSGDNEKVVGCYRLLSGAQADRAGGFSSEKEYDLSPLTNGSEGLLELGRSCVHPDYRGGVGLMLLWQSLARFVLKQNVRFLFGVASFPGTDVTRHQSALAWLEHTHPAPAEYRVRSKKPAKLSRSNEAEADALGIARHLPPLIKSYIRLGGKVGEGAFVDEDFGTTDVCMIVDMKSLNARQRRLYAGLA